MCVSIYPIPITFPIGAAIIRAERARRQLSSDITARG